MMKNFIKHLVIWNSFVHWCCILSLEVKTATFRVVNEHCDITDSSSVINSQNVSSLGGCAMQCNSDDRCLSFTACHEDGYIACKIFDQFQWEMTDMVPASSCFYYEDASYCVTPLKEKLLKFLNTLPTLKPVPDHFIQNKKKFLCSSLSVIKPRSGKLIEKIPKQTKSWFVSFDIKRINTNFLAGDKSVLQFWIHEKDKSYRSPGVWFSKEVNSFRLKIMSSLNDTWFPYISSKEIETDSFTNVFVTQYQNHARQYIYEIYINGDKVVEEVNNSAREYKKLRVHAIPSFQVAANCVIQNLVYSNLE